MFCRFLLPCQILLPPIKTVGITIRQRKMLPVKYSNNVLYSRLWIEGIQLPETNNKYFFLPIRLCFINVYTYHNPNPTPYSNTDTLNIVVQIEKKYAILMCACAVNRGRKI